MRETNESASEKFIAYAEEIAVIQLLDWQVKFYLMDIIAFYSSLIVLKLLSCVSLVSVETKNIISNLMYNYSPQPEAVATNKILTLLSARQ